MTTANNIEIDEDIDSIQTISISDIDFITDEENISVSIDVNDSTLLSVTTANGLLVNDVYSLDFILETKKCLQTNN